MFVRNRINVWHFYPTLLKEKNVLAAITDIQADKTASEI